MVVKIAHCAVLGLESPSYRAGIRRAGYGSTRVCVTDAARCLGYRAFLFASSREPTCLQSGLSGVGTIQGV